MTSRTKEENREYMRDYMRDRRRLRRAAGLKSNTAADRAYKRAEYKSEAPGCHTKGDFVRRDLALYDPMRDAPVRHADLTALVMGDPPIGRRAIDQHQARTGVRSISLAGARP